MGQREERRDGLDRVHDLLRRLACRAIPSRTRWVDGRVRLVLDDLLAEAPPNRQRALREEGGRLDGLRG
jgi:hypothetical protein